jgi:hypothetical protein
MQQSQYTTSFPILTIARVVSVNPTDHTIWIVLPSGTTTNTEVKILYNGQADFWRINQEPLPLPGTWGLVAFPYGDSRGGIWLGSIYSTSDINAITTNSPTPTVFDTQTKYYSHYSGYYRLIDYLGNSFERFPDGSSISISVSGVPPKIYGHQLSTDAQGNVIPITVQINDADRTPNPPSQPYFIGINHATGASIDIVPSGTITVSGVPPNGGTIVVDNAGNVIVNGGQVQVQGVPTPGAQIYLHSNGEIDVTNQSGALIQILQTGEITVKGASGAVIIIDTNGNLNIGCNNFTAIATGTATVTGAEVDIIGSTVNIKTNVNIG